MITKIQINKRAQQLVARYVFRGEMSEEFWFIIKAGEESPRLNPPFTLEDVEYKPYEDEDEDSLWERINEVSTVWRIDPEFAETLLNYHQLVIRKDPMYYWLRVEGNCGLDGGIIELIAQHELEKEEKKSND